VQRVSWAAGAAQIVNRVDLHAETGEFIGVIGPNGSGKSSLLRLIYRLMKPSAGLISLDARDLWALTARETAQAMAVVAQERSSDFDFTVQEVVMMGRTPHKRPLDSDSAVDATLVADALRQVGLTNFAGRSFNTLSGGEKQRVLVARALAQCAKVLVLDEPTNHLDIRYQIEMLELVRSLGVTVIAALHDLNLAARYCHRLYLLERGRVVAHGTADDVLTSAIIEQIYGVQVEIVRSATSGRLHIIFNDLCEASQGGVLRPQNGT
jgi:iron complex transport system ATP-binding protein